ncbi:MAG: sensor histidine kinase [Sandaracinaceae bacterium]
MSKGNETHNAGLRRISIPVSTLVTTALVVGAVGQYAVFDAERWMASTAPLVASMIALAHLLTQVPWLAWMMRSGRQDAVPLYFAVQIPLALCAVAVSQGRLGILVFALVSQAILLFRSRVTAAIVVVGISLASLACVAWFSPETALGVAVGYVTIGAFVVGFSELVARQYDSRHTVSRLAADLAEANARLAAQADTTAELAATRERNRVAREVHDVLGHYLTVVHVNLAAADKQLDADPARARALVEKARELTHEGLQELRSSLSLLRRERRPLDEALTRLASHATALDVHLDIEGTPRPLDEATELTLYRVAQEGLTNARRHAGATFVQLLLRFDDCVTLRVRDDGQGVEGAVSGSGLDGLRERVAEIGGVLNVVNMPQRGFELRVEVAG